MERKQLKKVLMLRSFFDIGGAEKHILVLSEELQAGGIGVVIGTAGGEGLSFPEMARIKIAKIRFIPSTFRNLLSPVITLYKLVKRGEFQVIHSHHRFSTLCAWIISRLLSVPLVSTEHGFFWDRKFIVRLFQPDSFVTATDAVKRHLVEHYRIRPEKISVIPNATTVGEENGEVFKRESIVSNPDAGVNICYGGRLTGEKGLLVLLDAWEKTANHFPGAHLWIIGDGIMRSEMERIVSDRGLSHRTTFTGFRQNMSDLLFSMDMVVLPSLIENMPMILLEAMACAIPVIATDVGGICELIENGEEGLLVRAGDSGSLYQGIKTLVEDSELRKKMGEGGRKKVLERFNTKKMGKEYIAFYLDVMNKYFGKKK